MPTPIIPGRRRRFRYGAGESAGQVARTDPQGHAKSIATVWVDYQLLGYAAAHNDSLSDPKQIDEAMWPAIANLKARKWYDIVSKGWGVEDTAAAQRQWQTGQILGADHILLLTQGQNDAQKADAKKRIDAIRARVTPLTSPRPPGYQPDQARRNRRPARLPRGDGSGIENAPALRLPGDLARRPDSVRLPYYPRPLDQ
jgi:hypothetical protein